jgi:hypothetical protein
MGRFLPCSELGNCRETCEGARRCTAEHGDWHTLRSGAEPIYERVGVVVPHGKGDWVELAKEAYDLVKRGK